MYTLVNKSNLLSSLWSHPFSIQYLLQLKSQVMTLLTNVIATAGITRGLGEHSYCILDSAWVSVAFRAWSSLAPGNVWNDPFRTVFTCIFMPIIVKRWHRRFSYVFIQQVLILEAIQTILTYVQSFPSTHLWD